MGSELMATCSECGDTFADERKSIGYDICLSCGDDRANKVKHTIAPMHKSNYIVVSNLTDLKGLNNKGGRYG